MKTRWLFVLLTGVLLITSCKKDPEFIGIERVRVAGLKDSVLYVHLAYVVYNPNGVKSKLNSSTMEVFYQGELVGSGRLLNKMSLASKDTIRIPVECAISLDKLHQYYRVLLQSEATNFRLRGTNQIDFLFSTISVKIDEEISINTRDIVQQEVKRNFSDATNFNVKSIALQRMPSLGKSNFSMTLDLTNQLPITYTIESMVLNFYRSSKKEIVAKWTLAAPIEQLKYANAQVPIEAEVNNLSLLKQGSLGWLFTQKATFHMFGEAVVRIGNYQFKVPIEDKVDLGF